MKQLKKNVFWVMLMGMMLLFSTKTFALTPPAMQISTEKNIVTKDNAILHFTMESNEMDGFELEIYKDGQVIKSGLKNMGAEGITKNAWWYDIVFDIKKDLGITLSPDTKYTYRIYTIKDNSRIDRLDYQTSHWFITKDADYVEPTTTSIQGLMPKKNEEFLINNGVLTGYRGTDSIINIPEGVIEIAQGAFNELEEYCKANKKSVMYDKTNDKQSDAVKKTEYPGQKIVLPLSMKKIGSWSIPGVCEEIVLNEGLEIIDDYGLVNCGDRIIELPSTVTYIGEDAFSKNVVKITGNCKSLILAKKAFMNDDNLRVLQICGVHKVSKRMIVKCNRLKRISLVGDYDKIEAGALNGAKDLRILRTSKKVIGKLTQKKLVKKNVTVNAKGMTFSDFYISKKMLIDYTGDATEIVIPQKVMKIADYAFYNNDTITKVTLHSKVKSIGEKAFYHCSRLTEIKISKKIKTIGKNAFKYCPVKK